MSVVELSELNTVSFVARVSTTRRFGNAIWRLRMEQELSQEALARAAKVHSTYVSLIERGKRDPKLTSIEKLAKGLDMPVSELLAEVE